MAPNHRRHFAHPQHLLMRTRYGRDSTHICDVCRSQLAGLVGYRCNACDIDIHEACADYFKETISFLAHPWHTLTLSRMPAGCVGWTCDLCEEECPPGSFVYRCVRCMFEVHPLCTMLPQNIRSPLHQEHELCMVPSSGYCSACREYLPVCHYVCGGSCLFRLHIACVSGAPSCGGQGGGGLAGQSSTGPGAGQVSNAASQTASSGYSGAVRPSRGPRESRLQVSSQDKLLCGDRRSNRRPGIAGVRCPRSGLGLIATS